MLKANDDGPSLQLHSFPSVAILKQNLCYFKEGRTWTEGYENINA